MFLSLLFQNSSEAAELVFCFSTNSLIDLSKSESLRTLETSVPVNVFMPTFSACCNASREGLVTVLSAIFPMAARAAGCVCVTSNLCKGSFVARPSATLFARVGLEIDARTGTGSPPISTVVGARPVIFSPIYFGPTMLVINPPVSPTAR